MKSDHGIGHKVAGGIGVKGAVYFMPFGDEGREPYWIGPGAGGGEAQQSANGVQTGPETSQTTYNGEFALESVQTVVIAGLRVNTYYAT